MAEANIKPINTSSIHHITSGQVIVDLATAIKELLENSLDAGSTNIEIRLKEYGTQSIEVVDNGSGIAPQDIDAVALKHHTSKLSTFDDLTSVTSFGFRGEALSSLCATCESVVITTAIQQDAPMGTVIELDRDGTVRNKLKKAARQRGTTVAVTNIFSNFPVRRKELLRNAKREYTKALNLLTAYALFPCTQENRGVRLTVSNQPEKGQRSVQLRTDGSTSLKSSITSVWGPKAMLNVEPLDIKLSVDLDKLVLKRLGLSERKTEIQVKGLVSKFAPACGRANSDRQFIFVNGRPCNSPKVQKAINEVYRQFNATQYPVIVVNFIIPPDAIDINVSPDKRTILLHGESRLVEELKVTLENEFQKERSTFSLTQSTAMNRSSSSSGPALSTSSDGVDIGVAAGASSSSGAGLTASSDDVGVGSSSSGLLLTTSSDVIDVDTDAVEHNEELQLLADGSSSSAARSSSSKSSSRRRSRLEKSAWYGPVEHTVYNPDDPTETNPSLNASGAATSSSSVENTRSGSKSVEAPAVLSRRSISPKPSKPSTVSTSMPRISSMPERTSVSRASSSRAESVQLVLSTKGASWSLTKEDEMIEVSAGDDVVEVEKPNKRRKLERAATDLTTSQVKKFSLSSFALGAKATVTPEPIVIDLDEESVPIDHLEEEVSMAIDAGTEAEEKEVDQLMSSPPASPTIHVRRVVPTIEDLPASSEGDSVLPSSTAVEEQVTEVTGQTSEGVLSATTRDENSEDIPLFVDDDSPEPEEDGEEEEEEAPRSVEIERTMSDSLAKQMEVSVDRMKQRWARLRALREQHSSQSSSSDDADTTGVNSEAGIGNVDADSASRALSRVIDKCDFGEMRILGQFNLGFIIARRKNVLTSRSSKDSMDDLFIIDQHASDEKYNFEKLQQETKIASQRLFQPLNLELSAAEEMVAVDNIEVLKSNGFEISVDPDCAYGVHQKVKLTAQPMSKSTVFDVKDLEELLHLMKDQPPSQGQIPRCSKARAMFASRACRKSVMIGMHLTKPQMSKIVKHMGQMDQPWNCPHGRPTMRHLANLRELIPTEGVQSRRERIDWADFLSDNL